MNNVELTYTNKYIPLSREELIEKLKNALTQSRFEHVLRVEQMAIELAKKNDVDVEKASVAGLCHDYAKQRPDDDFIQLIKKYRLDDLLLQYGNAIWHGEVGYLMVQNELGVTDIDILNSIKHHTTGAKYMSKLEQIVYMADYIEMGRDFPGVEEAREITFNNLADGVAYQTKHTLQYLISANKPVYPKTIDTYNEWVNGSNIK
ncbi:MULTISPECIES: bis(5'-nucleosyl)-tetraphosphatase (symmetrical) YqeK [Apilactobacillus]|uniref:bis(5'-nucleosyl)-tetraphosphatase (symmetrical) YqeK n=1 Tax=Apilactobacillus TaxID=2767877 RepID=UPI0006C46A81|nr:MULTISPECIES: bis(5'-nucleosyl)-tetraphosphatase (symmetrical) YqeK [Apilactobacillus]KOY74078.1 Metal dependent phosphohydrolase [Apilactobacillus kunkeei]MDN2612189.1 bis(5'-nucleosyl)-tetraphosphatase (symmetrical) YqeK [Apilactobacillus sp. EABW-1NA]